MKKEYLKVGGMRIRIVNDNDPDIRELAEAAVINGRPVARGYVERDFNQYPANMFTPPSEMDLVPGSEWEDRIKDQEKYESSLQHIRMHALGGRKMPSLDQNGQGYCWAYSCGAAITLLRARAGLAYVRMNPHSTASIIKQGRDQGGWCGLSLDHVRQHGMATEEKWPRHAFRNWRDLYTEEMKAHMLQYRVIEDWFDVNAALYDQTMTFNHVASQLLVNNPIQVDFNWWSHSVCAMRLVVVERGSYGLLIWNSWGDEWESDGMVVLRGNKARPNGACGPRVVRAYDAIDMPAATAA